MAPEISAERVAYTARRECLLLSDAGTKDDRANSSDSRTGRRLEENVRRKAKFGIGELSQVPRSSRKRGFERRRRLGPGTLGTFPGIARKGDGTIRN